MKIITVCTGNICRSIMAEVVLKHLFQSNFNQYQNNDVNIDSFAITSEEIGSPIDYRAEKILLQHGYDKSLWQKHRAQKITLNDLQSVDLVLPMTQYHYNYLVKMNGRNSDKIYMYRCFEHLDNFENLHFSHIAADLADPWYGGMSDFELALTQIEYNSKKIVDFMLNKNN